MTRDDIRATLPHAINFLFLPPRVVTDPVWDGVAADIFDALPAAEPAASAEADAAWEARHFAKDRPSGPRTQDGHALARNLRGCDPDVDWDAWVRDIETQAVAIRSAGTPSAEAAVDQAGYADPVIRLAFEHGYEVGRSVGTPPASREDEPDFLDGARLEYRECMEVRRLLGYLWTATGNNHLRPVHTLFDADDPIVADVERLAIMPDAETDR